LLLRSHQLDQRVETTRRTVTSHRTCP
jgi:hypothetical protein